MPASQPLHVGLATDLLTRIERGEWQPGSRLPAVRDIASEWGVSPFTVSRAIRLLTAAGRVETIQGKGSYVAAAVNPAPSPPQDLSWQHALLRKPSPARANAIVQPLIRQHDSPPDTIVLASGGETTDILPIKSLQTAWRDLVLNLSTTLLGGWSPAGEPPVREWMTDYLTQIGIHTRPERIVVTAGGQQALSLAAQTLLQADDTVLVERPIYPFALSIFEALGVRCVDVPVDEEGLRVDIAGDLMERFRPKLVFTVPTGQVPTGVTMPVSRRRALLDAARKFGVMILEDDHAGELSYDRPAPPPIKSFDTHGHVIYAKSFSKITLPALRIGCLVAEGPILDALIHAKLISDRYTSTVTQAAFLAYVTSAAFPRDLERCRTVYRTRRNAMLAALEREMPAGVSWTVPAASFYLWLTLPFGLSAQEVARRASGNGVIVARGGAFFVQADPDNAFRLTFTSNDVDRLTEGVRRLAATIKAALHDLELTGPLAPLSAAGYG